MMYKKLTDYITKQGNKANFLKVAPKDIVFEERVKLKCFYCEKYNKNRRCPPFADGIDFEKLVMEYEECMVVYTISNYRDLDEFMVVRRESTNYLHKLLLELEKICWVNEQVLAVSFIGGSCKLCKEDCGETCKNPKLARISVEAAGINILKTLKKTSNFDVKFNEDKVLYRIGLLLW